MDSLLLDWAPARQAEGPFAMYHGTIPRRRARSNAVSIRVAIEKPLEYQFIFSVVVLILDNTLRVSPPQLSQFIILIVFPVANSQQNRSCFAFLSPARILFIHDFAL